MTSPTPSTGDEVRLLAVHAHPDDESIWTGLLLARAVDRGARTSVLTCTLGEEGEVIGEALQGLVADATDQLGGYRYAELDAALGELRLGGGPRLLGGVGCWRDSGMAGTPSIAHPRAFAADDDAADAEDFAAQSAQLAEVIAEVRPHLIVTYGPDGGYGHPDHIRAHRLVHACVDKGHGGADLEAVLWAVTDRDAVAAGLQGVRAPEGWSLPEREDVAGVDHAEVDLELRAPECLPAKKEAMAAHATQIWIADGRGTRVNPEVREAQEGVPEVYCLSNLITLPLLDTEAYQVGWRAAGQDAFVTPAMRALGLDAAAATPKTEDHTA